MATLCALGALAVSGACGGGSPAAPPTNPTPPPVTTTTTTLPSYGICPSPTPPPLMALRPYPLHVDPDADLTVLDLDPIVQDVDDFCRKTDQDAGQRGGCRARPHGHPDRPACDSVAVGRAADTGRWGPTWTFEGRPCASGSDPGCRNHPTNQFLVRVKGKGFVEACAAPDVPVAGPDSRCNGIQVE
jgi:hypothetical protein